MAGVDITKDVGWLDGRAVPPATPELGVGNPGFFVGAFVVAGFLLFLEPNFGTCLNKSLIKFPRVIVL